MTLRTAGVLPTIPYILVGMFVIQPFQIRLQLAVKQILTHDGVAEVAVLRQSCDSTLPCGLLCIPSWQRNLEAGKIVGALVFGTNMVKVRGTYDDVNRLCTQIADRLGWAIVNVNLRPFYTEGAKTHGWEIVEQLGWKLPRHTVVPVAGGTILPKLWKAYREVRDLQLVEDNEPRIYGAQAAGCAPITTAIQSGTEWFDAVRPNTIARSIAIGNPADGGQALRAIRESGGWAESASDSEILEAIRLLARTEGIFTEPAGGTTLACAIKLIQSGRIAADESICVCITGNGLKTIEVLQDGAAEVPTINPRVSDFNELRALSIR